MTKNVEYRPVAKPKINKASTSKDDTTNASTFRQPKKNDKIVKTTNVFEVLTELDEGKSDNMEPSSNFNTLTNVENPPIDERNLPKNIVPNEGSSTGKDG